MHVGLEIYDLSTEKWNYTANLAILRSSHTATMLNLGQVLAIGGERN